MTLETVAWRTRRSALSREPDISTVTWISCWYLGLYRFGFLYSSILIMLFESIWAVLQSSSIGMVRSWSSRSSQ